MRTELKSTLLYKMHRDALIEYANGIVNDRACAEDVVQIAWQRLHKIESTRILAEPLRYFYRIVRNLAIDIERARKRDITRYGREIADISDFIPDKSLNIEQQILIREKLEIVLSAIDEMPEKNRIALTLHNVEGLKLREVAEKMGISITYTHELIADAKLYCIKKLSEL